MISSQAHPLFLPSCPSLLNRRFYHVNHVHPSNSPLKIAPESRLHRDQQAPSTIRRESHALSPYEGEPGTRLRVDNRRLAGVRSCEDIRAAH